MKTKTLCLVGIIVAILTIPIVLIELSPPTIIAYGIIVALIDAFLSLPILASMIIAYLFIAIGSVVFFTKRTP